MSRATTLPRVTVLRRGASLPDGLQDSLVEVEVERAWDAPGLLALRFLDPPGTAEGHEPLDPGDPVSLRIDDGGGAIDLGQFEVSEVRWTYSAQGDRTLLVLALDRLHRLQRRSTGVRLHDTTLRAALSDAVKGALRSVAGDVPARKHPSVLQAQGTDLDLVRRLCRAAARRFHLDGEQLRLVVPGETRGAPVALRLGDSLHSLTLARSIEGQPGAVYARAWDPDRQEAHIGKAKRPQRADLGRPEGADDAAPLYVHARPLPAGDDAEQLAQGALDRFADRSLHLEGVCDGRAGVELGGAVDLAGLAPQHCGVFAVDRVQHRVHPREGWTTRFEVGAPPLEPAPTPEPRALGCTPAVVTDTDDPKKQGRVRVRYEALGEDLQSDWLRVVQAGAGKGGGQFVVPHRDDEVLVILESESLDAGYVLGGLYSRVHAPADPFAQAPRAVQGFQTRSGHRLTLDDAHDTIELRLERGGRLRIRDSQLLLRSGGSLRAEDGHGNTMELSSRGVELRSSSSLDVVADGHLNLAGGTVRIAGSRIDFVKT